MFKALFGRKVAADHAHALYGSVVARSRDQKFYSEIGVPDTFDGRFELLVMHLFMFHHLMRHENQELRKVSQLVFDAFIDDMDSALREAAVGDQVVPKRISKMTRVFYGRSEAFEQALSAENPEGELQLVLSRNLFPDDAPELSGGQSRCCNRLAKYMLWTMQDLSAKTPNEIVQQTLLYPGPLIEGTHYLD